MVGILVRAACVVMAACCAGKLAATPIYYLIDADKKTVARSDSMGFEKASSQGVDDFGEISVEKAKFGPGGEITEKSAKLKPGGEIAVKKGGAEAAAELDETDSPAQR